MKEKAEYADALYADFRVNQQIELPEAREKYDACVQNLVERINEITETSDSPLPSWKLRQMALHQFYMAMLSDAFKDHGVEWPEGMEIYFAGSLAKQQATQYSDLDAFALFKNEGDLELAKPVFKAVDNLCQRIFLEHNQLFPDPIGINPERFSGTVDQLIAFLAEGNNKTDTMVRSIISRKPLGAHYQLGYELERRIRNNSKLNRHLTVDTLLDLAFTEYAAPPANALSINIKDTIFRPLDFMLMALREQYGISEIDGSHLYTPNTLDILQEKGLIPNEMIDSLRSTFNIAMRIRYTLHSDHKREMDVVEKDDSIANLLENIEQFRQYLKSQITPSGLADNIQLSESLPRHVNNASRKTEAPHQVYANPLEQSKSSGNKLLGSRSLKLLGISSLVLASLALSLIGVGVGLGLLFTGILAPFGVGVLAIVATVAIGIIPGLALFSFGSSASAAGYAVKKGIETVKTISDRPAQRGYRLIDDAHSSKNTGPSLHFFQRKGQADNSSPGSKNTPRPG